MKNKQHVFIYSLFVMGSFVTTLIGCTNNDENPGGDPPMAGTVVDKDGNKYDTVRIGTQTWMVQNLKTTKYNDGTDIPAATLTSDWPNVITPCYCWYNNDAANKTAYGAMYNWYAVNSGKLCPTGWRVPTVADFDVLRTFLGGMSMCETKIMEAGTMHWTVNSAQVTNSSGFTALPGGYRWSTFSGMGSTACWWTSMTNGSSSAWYKSLGGYMLTTNSATKSYGMSVRCIKE
jgi:uncharacterized protein (TIGR02145 family)